MELVTLQPWVYPTTFTGPMPYVPQDAIGRYPNISATPYQNNVYIPNHLVENYSSLVWKEGFRSSGEFELKTNDVEPTLNLLQKGTLVSVLDSNEVCIVTSQHIGTDEDGRDVLTVTGKSLLLYILENRPTRAHTKLETNDNTNAVETVNLVFQVPDHIAFLMWSAIVFPHSEGNYTISKKMFDLPFNVIVPHTAISVSVATKGAFYRSKWPPPIESRIDSVAALLDLDPSYGIRTIRPKGVSASIYRPTMTSLRGEGNLTVTNNIDKMLFDVYQGVDRSKDNTNRVIFRWDSGDIESAEYLSSIDGHKNFVNSHAELNRETFPNYNPSDHSEIVWAGDNRIDANGTPMITNLEQRKYVNGLAFRFGEVSSSADLKDSGITDANLSRLHDDGVKYLKENKEIDMLTADISPQTHYRFKEHYNLGDIVLVHGKYGGVQKMVVSEYTRTEELTEESGFPTLTKWEEPID